MDLIISKNNFKWFFYILISIVYSVTQINYLMYFVLAYQLFEVILRIKQQNTILYEKSFFELIIVALILPDDYIIIILVFVYYVLHINLTKVKKFDLCCIVLSAVYILLNIVMNRVNIVVIVFSVLYFLPFILCKTLTENLLLKYSLPKHYILDILKKILVLESVSVITYLFSHYSYVKTLQDSDWLVGTLGEYKCTVLTVICAFIFFIFLNELFEKGKFDFIGLIFPVTIIVSATSILYLGAFCAAVGIGCLFSTKISIKIKLMVLGISVIGVIVFLLVSPYWIIREFSYLLDFNYFINRVLKVRYYLNTFIVMPINEGILKFLFGVGLGCYTSRTAMTCFGGYIGLYDRFFPNIPMFYREKYITSMSYFGISGLAASAESSIMAMQGELGLICLIFVICLFLLLIKKGKSTASSIVVLYFLGLMIVDNALEYAKYGFIFWLAYYICKNKYFLQERDDINDFYSDR